MSGLKTLIATVFFAIALVPQLRADDLARQFAACAGRLSAQMEHAWLVQDAAADDFAVLRRDMIDLLDAVVGKDTARAILAYRIDAKLAHQALLQRAEFGRSADDADWARRRATEQVAHCTRLVRPEPVSLPRVETPATGTRLSVSAPRQ